MNREEINSSVAEFLKRGGVITVARSRKAKGVPALKMKIQGSADHSYRRMINSRYATRESQGYAQVNYTKIELYKI